MKVYEIQWESPKIITIFGNTLIDKRLVFLIFFDNILASK